MPERLDGVIDGSHIILGERRGSLGSVDLGRYHGSDSQPRVRSCRIRLRTLGKRPRSLIPCATRPSPRKSPRSKNSMIPIFMRSRRTGRPRATRHSPELGLLGIVVRGTFPQHLRPLRETRRVIKEDGDGGGSGVPGQICGAAPMARDARGPARVVHLPGCAGLAGALGQARAAGRGRGPRYDHERALARGRDSGAPAAGEAPPPAMDHRRVHGGDGLPR